MNQTLRESVKDAATMRREYLWKKRSAYSLVIVGCLVACSSLLVLLWLLLPIVLFQNPDYLYVLAAEGESGLPMSYEQWRVAQPIIILVLTMTVVSAALLCRNKVKQVSALPYVPPVSEQIAALPADKILVRGADEPATTPNELLRAVRTGKKYGAKDLRRAQEVRSAEEPQPEAPEIQRVPH